ncbi:PLDc N-terminal domain-containing protein [Thiolinea disciformis]|uniref:PLDc N-terminal domain-containing protein n=1 Tax=Thiolinea disciformis TaxID=125614 RepID=UPI000364EE3F
MLSGFLGFLILIIDIYIIFKVFKSSASLGKKILWTAIIFFLPVVGILLWWFLGPK